VEFGKGLLRLRTFDGNARKNSKGCDIGYALAASSCEGANRVDACTVTALDAITAFAVPNPNCSSQSQSVFSGLALSGLPRLADHPAYFGLAKFYLSQPFQPSTCAKLNSCFIDVNASFHQLFKYLWM
jgi:hypothetical protein